MARKKATKKAPVRKASKKAVKKTAKKSVKKAAKKVVKRRASSSVSKPLIKNPSTPSFDVGKMSFLAGLGLSVVIGVIIGVLNLKMTLGVGITFAIVFILGLLVGLLNITTEEVNEFLLASIAFMAASGVNIFVISLTLPQFGGILKQIFFALSIFVAPAATIVAFKAMYALAKT